jgi:phosphatidylinositol kinase/protein kinase (PI-3  family)
MKMIDRDADLDKLQAAAGSMDDGVAEELKTKNFKKFELHCCKAYEILRLNADQLVTLFQIMLSAGMPELNHDENIQKMVERLHLKMTEREASKHFKVEI